MHAKYEHLQDDPVYCHNLRAPVQIDLDLVEYIKHQDSEGSRHTVVVSETAMPDLSIAAM